jgi:hypothetical protein
MIQGYNVGSFISHEKAVEWQLGSKGGKDTKKAVTFRV